MAHLPDTGQIIRYTGAIGEDPPAWQSKRCRTKWSDASLEESKRRVALGFPQTIPMKAACKPALHLYCPAPLRVSSQSFSSTKTAALVK